MRDALVQTLYELAKRDERVVVVVADISPAGAMEDFRREFPSRFINVGVAEASMIGLAAGLAMRGYRPFCYTIATFALFRCYEQIRCDLAYQDLPVTVVGMGAGLSYSTLGGTHQAVEDVAVAMACPNLTVLAPCDPAETAECVRWCASRESGGPVYMRIGKAGEPDLTSGAQPWEFGRLRWLRRGDGRHNIVTYGPIASLALALADRLASPLEEGGRERLYGVAAAHSLTNLASEDVFRLVARDCVVLEEAAAAPLARLLNGYLEYGSAVRSFALPRAFPHVHGTREELLERAGLTVDAMIRKIV